MRIRASRLARESETALLDALSDFVNLRGSIRPTRDIQPLDVKGFRLKHPNFFPNDCYDVAEGKPAWPGLTEGQGVLYFRMYQHWLRALWRPKRKLKVLENRRLLDILLGLEPDRLSPLPRIGRDGWLPRANNMANWEKGDFHYAPACAFQRAVWELFRHKWRAKVCGRCFKLFIADKPAQRFCGIACGSSAEKSRKLGWWKKHGEAWRKARQASSEKKSSTKAR